MDSSDTTSSPYEEVNKFFVFVPSVRVFGSRSSGDRFVMKFTMEVQKLVERGIMIGT